MTDLGLLIDGELVVPDRQLDVVNPATGGIFRAVPRANATHVEQAVAAAKRAFPAWRDTPLAQRRQSVLALAEAIDARRREFAETLVGEQGKPLAQALGEVDWTTDFLRGYASIDVPVDVILDDDTHRMETHYRPLGVVVGIAPWNFPLFLLTLKLGAATLAGNTFIAKPAPSTPVTMLMVGELARDVFPAGVVNVLVDANDLGPTLVEHPAVAKISFTGSTATGRKIAQSAAATLKKVSLELGGNDAALVLDDVDVDDVAQKLFDAAFLNAGQVCIAVKRVYAANAVYEELCDALGKIARDAALGAGTEAGVTVGPVQNAQQFEKAKGFLEHANRDGTVLAGGHVRGDGYFVEPTVVTDIGAHSALVREEQFAPILPVVRFDDLDDAIDEINASPFGLGGSVWSGDVARAYEVAQRLDTGTVWVNHHLHLHPMVPVGGAKESGNGIDYGIEGLKQYTQATVIRIPK
ncbi:MAG: aldehyde dehydrogenase family protein [Mycobacterium sp.]